MKANCESMSGVDILDRIDEVTAPVCGTCSEPLAEDGPSLYFCDDRCSDSWHRTQGEPLVGYVDPWHRPDEFPGIGSDAHVSAEQSAAPEVVRFDQGRTIHVPPGTWTGARAMRQLGESLRPMFEQMQRPGIVDEPPAEDPRERALTARRRRGTGLTPRGRAPRTIGRASTSARR